MLNSEQDLRAHWAFVQYLYSICRDRDRLGADLTVYSQFPGVEFGICLSMSEDEKITQAV
jgi:hypothetical protein